MENSITHYLVRFALGRGAYNLAGSLTIHFLLNCILWMLLVYANVSLVLKVTLFITPSSKRKYCLFKNEKTGHLCLTRSSERFVTE